MKIQENCPPSQARQVFKLKPYKNLGIGIIAFLVVFATLLLFLNLWIASGVALLPAFCLYLYLESRVIIIKCPNCKQNIDTSTPWLCGFKACRNENVSHQYPFIHECEHCHFIPKAYQCHHCGKPVFLTTDRQKLHAAKCLDAPAPAPVAVRAAVFEEKVITQQDEVRDLEHELRKTSLKKQIEIEASKPVTPLATAIKTPEQALEEEIEKALKGTVTLYDIERRLKAKANEDFAGDGHGLAQRLSLIKQEIGKRL